MMDVFKKYWKWIAVILVGIPFLINVIMCFTDFMYSQKGWTFSPTGINNKEWLEFWCAYLVGGIALISAILVWCSSKVERERKNNQEIERLYMDDVKRQQEVLVHVSKSIDTSLAYKIITQIGFFDLNEQRRSINEATDLVLNAQSELELQTDISVKSDCENKKCVYYNIVKAVRDIYYKLEKNLLKLIGLCDEYVMKTNYKANLQKQKCNYEEMDRLKGIHIWQDNIEDLEQQIKAIEEQLKLYDTQIKELNNKIAIDKPIFISHSKAYIDYKKSKASEILETGVIKMYNDTCVNSNPEVICSNKK